MRQPSPSPAPAATETVTRPEPGLARGVWEAPAWAFWVMLALIVLGGVAYALRRLGVLRFGRNDARASSRSSEPHSPSPR